MKDREKLQNLERTLSRVKEFKASGQKSPEAKPLKRLSTIPKHDLFITK